jgi:HK97 family phage major capsid protein/HK97 family phage prohead protease
VIQRAYAVLHVKALDAERRTITGIASTPEPDRMGDVIEPLGIAFNNPLPLLLYHDTRKPVGSVILSPPTAEGLAFEATLPIVAEPGALRDRIDEAWHSIKAGLLAGVSIGFRALETPKQIKPVGARFLKTEVLELSLVTIPANAAATIHTIKSLDLAASGLHPSRDRDPHPIVRVTKGAPAMTITEQITAFENKRAAHVGRLTEIQTKCAEEGRSKDEAEREEFTTLQTEVKTIDAELVDLRDMEKITMTQAKPVVPAVKAFVPAITVKPNVAPGTAFVRMACATLLCKGNKFEAAEYAKRWNDSTPEVALALKAAVAAGTTTDATWAGPLVNQNISNDFIALLRPATILGKIPGLRTVPFNTKVPTQTGGGTYGWVGEAKPKPVTKLALGTTSLSIAKAAGIIVLTEELVRLSNPAAEDLARGDMIAGIAQFLDLQFIDPAVAAVAGVNPASITNGAPTAAATTSPLADILGLISHFATNNISVAGVTFIMSAANALALSFRTNLDGSPMFPGIGIDGGSYRGLTFVTSQAAGANVIALQPSLILYADDGGVTIDASREASLQMDSAPMSPADATTVYISLWQNNLVGLRAERFVNWAKANANAVKYLTAAAYPAPSGATGLVAPAGETGSRK